MTMIQNPIRRGFYPDPSVCRVGKTYYSVHSSFAYAPGIPIFTSTNLIEWEQIGHVLVTPAQLKLEHTGTSEGIYAPTIRYYEGIFYVIVTNVPNGGNFYVTSENPEKGWSEPFYLPKAEGIDPSLYFENGHCYYIGQRTKKNAAYFGDCEIWLQELDLEKQKLTGEQFVLWSGALQNPCWPEGPHVYKRNHYYYLLIAEGGTSYEHSICVARSEKLTGPYVGCPCNPIFTHRNLGHQYPVENAGHGDLFDTPEGEWYIAMLATRMEEGCGELGRETFLADVTWEEDWPVVNAGEGKLRAFQRVGKGTDLQERRPPFHQVVMWQEPLDKNVIGLRKNVLLEHVKGCKTENGRLELPMLPAALSDTALPAFLGIRVQERIFHMEVTLEEFTDPLKGEELEAGIAYYYDEKNYITFTIRAYMPESENRDSRQTPHREITITSHIRGISMIFACEKVTDTTENKHLHTLRLSGKNRKAQFFLDEKRIGENLDLSPFCTEKAGGFTGCVIGVYAHSTNETAALNDVPMAVFHALKVTWNPGGIS